MKKIFIVFIGLFLLSSCNPSGKDVAKKSNDSQKDTSSLPLVSLSNRGIYKEWYPGHKQLKISGRKNDKGERMGIWKSFSREGVQLSLELYNKGKKDGFTIVKYPNGMTHYTGQYKQDKKVGQWIFYDSSGKSTDTLNYNKKK